AGRERIKLSYTIKIFEIVQKQAAGTRNLREGETLRFHQLSPWQLHFRQGRRWRESSTHFGCDSFIDDAKFYGGRLPYPIMFTRSGELFHTTVNFVAILIHKSQVET